MASYPGRKVPPLQGLWGRGEAAAAFGCALCAPGGSPVTSVCAAEGTASVSAFGGTEDAGNFCGRGGGDTPR